MAKLFKLKVNTPNGTFFEDDIYQIDITTNSGVIGILADHQPIIGSITPSLCWIKDSKGTRVSALVNGGVFQMDGKMVTIITDFFDFTTNLNDTVIKKRRESIQHALENRNIKDEKILEGVQRKLNQELDNLNKLSKK